LRQVTADRRQSETNEAHQQCITQIRESQQEAQATSGVETAAARPKIALNWQVTPPASNFGTLSVICKHCNAFFFQMKNSQHFAALTGLCGCPKSANSKNNYKHSI
jgi:hypothetical protein